MNENQISSLETLEQVFQYANQVCDPLDYQIRQRNLTYAICVHLLQPLKEKRQKEAQEAQQNQHVEEKTSHA